MTPTPREQLLEPYGRFYGEQRFAVAFTSSIAGDDAKRVTTQGWDKTAPLADGNFGAALVGNRGLKRNVAVVLRPSRLVVIECDTEEDFARIQTLGLPKTLTVRSSKPYKRHYYFRPDPAMEMLPYVAFRFESGKVTADSGRYFLAPPSLHPSGEVYSFIPGHGPNEVEISILSDHLYRQITEQARAETSDLRTAIETDPEAKIRAGNRRDLIFRYACMLRRWGLSEQAILQQCHQFNETRCDPPVEREHIAVQVAGAMKKTGGQELLVQDEQANAATPIEPKAAVEVETWDQFSARAGEHVPVLIEGLWPEQALGFIAAPPKKGKTWIAIALALSVSTGRPYLGRFRVPRPRPVLYVALEGARSALRARIGSLAHGMDINPEPGKDLERFHVAYKPRGINISDPEWGTALRAAANATDASLVVIDVLRAAAAIKENSSEDFAALRTNLEPILADGRSIALLHHFGKLTEITKERTPGERMSGSGAMYGAMDIGVFITGSEHGARKLRLEIESRDLATPASIGVHLRGEGSGEHGGFTYHDTATFDCDEDMPDERDVKASAEEIRDYVIEQGGDVEAKQVRVWFEISEPTLTRRLGRLMQMGIDYIGGRGKPGRLVVREVPTSGDPTHVGTLELTNFPAQPCDIAPSSNKFQHEAISELDLAQTQGKTSSKVPTSPTEMPAPPAAYGNSDDHERPPIDDTLMPYEDTE